jgi:hypothetical protein
MAFLRSFDVVRLAEANSMRRKKRGSGWRRLAQKSGIWWKACGLARIDCTGEGLALSRPPEGA